MRVSIEADNLRGMTETKTSPSSSATDPVFAVRAQYIKDFSFENPNAPRSLMPKSEQPKLDVSVDLNAVQISEDLYEVVVHIQSKASAETDTLFMVDLSYAGLFAIQHLSREQIEPLLFVECPHIIFPFARRVIADATRDGGFPPLMLEPIDFHRLYQQRKQQQQPQVA